MDACEPAAVEAPEVLAPAAILRGTASGLEAIVDGRASLEAIASAIEKRIDAAPGFFRGSDIRIRIEDGPLALGALARLEELARSYDLRIIEVGPAKKQLRDDSVPQPNIAEASPPSGSPAAHTLESDSGENKLQAAPIELAELAPGARLVVGPVRSGVILEHTGHVVIFGDVNPGAEVRAQGNIIVLGRLRGTAHAGIGQDAAFILALALEPQQLRICRQVARAADSDDAAALTEIAHISGGKIVVERYAGKLPLGLAATI